MVPEIEVKEKWKTVYVFDTNVVINQAFAPHILAGNGAVVNEKTGNPLADRLTPPQPHDEGPNVVVCSSIVHGELDSLAHSERNDGVRISAREASRVIDDITTSQNRFVERDMLGVTLDNGGKFFFYEHDEELFLSKPKYNSGADDRLIFDMIQLMTKDLSTPTRYQFVSDDTNARTRCRVRCAQLLSDKPNKEMLLEFCTAPFRYERIHDPYARYPGRVVVDCDSVFLKNAMKGPLVLSAPVVPEHVYRLKLKPNQFLELRCQDLVAYSQVEQTNDGLVIRPLKYEERMQKLFDLTKYDALEKIPIPTTLTMQEVNHLLKRLSRADRKIILDLKKEAKDEETPETLALLYRQAYWRAVECGSGPLQGGESPLRGYAFNAGLRPMQQQKLAAELLFGPTPLVSLLGPGGCGKTLWATYCGFAEVAAGNYRSLKYIRPLIGLDEGIGWLPGDRGKKLAPWMAPIGNAIRRTFGVNRELWTKPETTQKMVAMEAAGILELEVPTFQAGDQWDNQYVIIDEAHLLTRKQLKLLISRAGDNCKVIVLGDPEQTGSVERPHFQVNQWNNGLAHLVDKLAGDPLYGHVTLPTQCIYRSQVAKLAERL